MHGVKNRHSDGIEVWKAQKGVPANTMLGEVLLTTSLVR